MTVARTSSKLMRVGPYQLLARLGEGRTGAMHLGMMEAPPGTKKLAVIKELSDELAGSSTFRERFSHEVRLAGQLTHPNIAQTHGIYEEHGRVYLAQEYCDGQPWWRIRELLWRRGAVPDGLHLKVLLEVLSGLQYSQELRDEAGVPLEIVHCDVSPQHVFVAYDGSVKLVDFGIARAVLEAAEPALALTALKLAYLAPEQARGEPVDRRADVFAVGVMLWEAMTCQRFVQNDDASEVRRRRGTGEEPRVRAIVPDAAPALADICDRALAVEPDERFATAAELRAALLGYVGDEVLDADRARLGELARGAFEQERARVHALIEQHSQLASLPTIPRASLAVAPKPRPPQRSSDLERASLSRRVDKTAAPAELSRNGFTALRRRPLPLIVAGVALLSFTITWLVSRPEPHTTTLDAATVAGELRAPQKPSAHEEPARSPSATASAEVEQAARDTSILLKISALPTSAVLYLDGVPLSDNPFTARVPADHKVHSLRASGPGLATQERSITFEHDQVVTLSLQPRAARPEAARAPRPSRKAQAASVAPGATAPNARSIDTETPSGPRQRVRTSDLYDTPLRVGRTPRAIYEDDPYGSQ